MKILLKQTGMGSGSDKVNPWEAKTVAAVLKELKVTDGAGLTDDEVKKRQEGYGLNEVQEKKEPKLLIFLRHFWGLTAFMLEFTVLVSFLLHKFTDVYLISGLMLFNAVISFIQETRAAKTVSALKQSLQVMVRVLRGGKWGQVTGNQLVPGDIIRIRTGDMMTADSKLIAGVAGADESALTGESKVIGKKGGDILYAGSIIKNGESNAIVVATGLKTFFGKTAQLVQEARPRLHMDEVVANVVKILFSIVGVSLAVLIGVAIFRGEPFLSSLPLLLILLISAVPVALPAMFTVSMANGSRQLAKKGVLVSRLSATEDAATMTTLCLDKTGTLTENKLSVQQVIAAKGFTEEDVLKYAVLSSVTANYDPIDSAFISKAETDKIKVTGYKQTAFIPFTAALKRVEATVQNDGKEFKVMKGAYDTIKELCHFHEDGFDKAVQTWAVEGFKTIAVAVSQGDKIRMAGIAALIDPPLPGSAGMIARIKELGIKVKMLTGDALPIAKEIALQVDVGKDIVSASLFSKNSGASDMHRLITAHDGFAGVLPQDKFNIVKALQQYKEITGMTGDGVNDAPALKQAEVGIAVRSATDVAKQAASVILLKEGLENIINLVTVGRSIHHRITNWVVSKISKTLFTVIFVCTAYIITGKFIVNALDMIALLFMLDFVSLTLSTDTVSWSLQPETWDIWPLVKKGFTLGLLATAEGLLWLFIGNKYFAIPAPGQLHSFGFAILFFTGIFNIIIVREPARFYQQKIGMMLLFAIIADVVLVIFMLTVKIPGFTVLPVGLTISSVAYFSLSAFLLNDWVKVKISGRA